MYTANVEEFALELDGKILERFNINILQLEDTPERRKKIIDLHIKKNELFDSTGNLRADDYEGLASARAELEVLEFQMQVAWGFTIDASKHTWWKYLPHCKCALIGTYMYGPYNRHYYIDCPVHGQKAVW